MENVTGWRENLGALGRAVSNRDSQDDEITRILIASIGGILYFWLEEAILEKLRKW